MEPFISGYADGETPNPSVHWDRSVRLEVMLDSPEQARLRHAGDRSTRGRPSLRERGHCYRIRGRCRRDQTYMLAALSPQSLAPDGGPLGDL